MLRESNFQEWARIIFHRQILYCPKRVPGLFLFCGSTFFFFSFCPLLTTTMCASFNPSCGTCSLVFFCFGEARRFHFVLPIVVHLERDCNTIAFPRSSSLHTVNARGSIISLAHGFSSWHIPLQRHDMIIDLWKAKTRTFDTRLIRWDVSRSFWSWQPLPPSESKIENKN